MYKTLDEYKKAVIDALIQMGCDKDNAPHMVEAYIDDVEEAFKENWLPLQVAMPISQNF